MKKPAPPLDEYLGDRSLFWLSVKLEGVIKPPDLLLPTSLEPPALINTLHLTYSVSSTSCKPWLIIEEVYP
jgi:hypothetical protein